MRDGSIHALTTSWPETAAPTPAVRALIVFGMVMGATGVGALFAVGGAVAGAAVGVLAETPARKAAARATKA